MLVISRKPGESVKVADNIEITIISVDGARVRLGIQAPRSVRILRTELAIAESANKEAVMAQDPQAEDLLKLAAQAKRKP